MFVGEVETNEPQEEYFFHFLKDCLNTNYCLSYKAGLDMFMWGNMLPFRIKKEYA